MKYVILVVSTFGFALAICIFIIIPDISKGLEFYLAQLSCYYSLTIYLLIICSYSNPKFYPRPIYYCKFPIRYFDFIKLSSAHLLKSKVAIPVLLVPISYIYWIIAIPNLAFYGIVMLIACYLEILLLSYILPFLIFKFEKITATRIPETILIYCVSLLYVSQNSKTIWPLLLNPLGNFLYIPIFISKNQNIILAGLLISVVITFTIIYAMRKGINKWEI